MGGGHLSDKMLVLQIPFFPEIILYCITLKLIAHVLVNTSSVPV